MPRRRSEIEERILSYLEKKKSPVTFIELYANMRQFTKQAIRNRMYKMMKMGIVEKLSKKKTVKGGLTVSFRLRK